MEKLYTVASYVGDHPLDNQDWWGEGFTDLQEAITAAQDQHQKIAVKFADVYTMVLDYEAIEAGEDDVVWLIHQDKVRLGQDAEAFANYLATRDDGPPESVYGATK
jgi:hypothetical protein